jgi:hypothetical protein
MIERIMDLVFSRFPVAKAILGILSGNGATMPPEWNRTIP